MTREELEQLPGEQIVRLMMEETELARVRRLFCQHVARIEQALAQRRHTDIIARRRMEFQAALAIIEELRK